MGFVAVRTNHESPSPHRRPLFPTHIHTRTCAHSSGSHPSSPVVDARALQPVLRAIAFGSTTTASTPATAAEDRDVVLGNALQALPAVRESLAAAGVVLPSPPSSASLASLGPEASPSQPPQRRRRGSSSSSSSSSSLAALAAAALAAPASPAAPPLGPAEMGEQVRQSMHTCRVASSI